MTRHCPPCRNVNAGLLVLSVLTFVSVGSETRVTAQQAPIPPPKVLSTVPDPPAGAVAEPVQMSGMPLQVGDLPPGIVVVRVIRRSFAENVSNQRVDLRVGAGGRTVTATTDSAGRAQFNGQTIGASVTATSVVDGERLESQAFEIPPQGGVRMVLVAGVGAGAPASADSASTPGLPPALGALNMQSALTAPPAAGPAATVADDTLTFTVRRSTLTAVAGVVVLGGVALAFVGWRKWGTPEAAAESTAPSAELPAAGASETAVAARTLSAAAGIGHAGRRAQAFQELVRLEREFAASRLSEGDFGIQREALLNEIATFDAAITPDGRRV